MTGKALANDEKPLRPCGTPPLAGEAKEWRGIALKASTGKGRWHGVPEGFLCHCVHYCNICSHFSCPIEERSVFKTKKSLYTRRL